MGRNYHTLLGYPSLSGQSLQPHLQIKEITAPPPPAAFAAFLHEPYAVLLDRAMAEVSGWGDHCSFITADPFIVLRSWGRRVAVNGPQGHTEEAGDPFAVLRRLLRHYSIPAAPGLPPFLGGAIGYLGYDLGHHLERLPQTAEDDLGLPEMYLAFYDWALAFDHSSSRAWLIATGLPEGSAQAATQRLAWAEEKLAKLPALPSSEAANNTRRGLCSNFTEEGYLAALRRAKDYITAGDIYQVNLSQRLHGPLTADPWQLYQRLRRVNPAPFASYLKFPEVTVASASPEEFLRLEARRVTTRPIKGTRPRGRRPVEDQALAQGLLSSEKDRAENVMIVDLVRNDLGRVCSIGSVRVPALFELERHPTVFHLVSTITGELTEGKDVVDLLRASFPGGSVTGAPKIRAMEIIDELEPHRRGIYCGGIGFLSFSGDLHLSMVIRTLVLANNSFYLHVGGAIVADSDPADEYRETLHKGRGLLRALGYGD